KGLQEGRTQATQSAVQKVLAKRLKLAPDAISSRLASLSAPQLDALLEAALDFESPADFENWLRQRA
ncbi:MAG: hypothetical protein RIR26_2638, partial [Pseudomonadota bacterium]